MTDPAFLLSYALLWVITVIQSIVLIQLLRCRAQRQRPTAVPSASSAATASATRVRPGTVFPEFAASYADSGEPADLADLRGISFVMMLSAGGCRNCVEALPAVRDTARRLDSKLVVVCVGPRTGCADYSSAVEEGTVVLNDPGGRSVRAFGTSSVPYVVAVDESGRLTAVGGGPDSHGVWRFADMLESAGHAEGVR